MDRCTRSFARHRLGLSETRTSAVATSRLTAGKLPPCPDRSGPLPTGTGERNKRGSDPFMLHVTCDLCGKELRPGEDHHFVVKVEVFAAHDPTELTEADLDEDHMEAFGELLRETEEATASDPLPPACQQLRYDLCPNCRQRFLRDPLGKDAVQKFDFSEN